MTDAKITLVLILISFALGALLNYIVIPLFAIAIALKDDIREAIKNVNSDKQIAIK